MQIETLQEGAQLSLFEIHLDGDEVPYRVYAPDARHAIKSAQAIAVTTNLISTSIALFVSK